MKGEGGGSKLSINLLTCIDILRIDFLICMFFLDFSP